MAGHSKWANIKHKKSKEDKRRGKIFTKIVKEIIIATREGGKDIEMNARLRLAVENAKSVNMPKKNIEKAIQKGAGEGDGANYEEYTYEGYGPNGVAVIVEVVTDNKNRTVSELRHAFDKNSGNLAANGAVSWNFEKKGTIIVEKTEEVDEETIMDIAIEAGADDVIVENDYFQILTAFADLHTVKIEIEKKFSIAEAGVEQIPKTTVNANDFAEELIKLINELEDLDDVQNVFSNYEISDEILEGLDI